MKQYYDIYKDTHIQQNKFSKKIFELRRFQAQIVTLKDVNG